MVVEPLLREWADTTARIKALLEGESAAKSRSVATKLHNKARDLYSDFLDRLRRFRVLDPACGSGNFLNLALLALILAATLFAARLSPELRERLARVHRPSLRHFTTMLASAAVAAGCVHLFIHGVS